jgi:Xaa-Pro aminopeptidase
MKSKPTYNFDIAKKIMEKNGIDALIASSPQNFYYISGFFNRTIFSTAPAFMPVYAIIPKEETDKPTLVMPDALAELTRSESWVEDQRYCYSGFTLEKRPPIESIPLTPIGTVAKVIEEKKLASGTIGIEEMTLAAATYKDLKQKLDRAKFVDASALFKELRCIKSKEEVQKISKAVKITEKAIEAAWNTVQEGVTELEVVNEYKSTVTKEGGEVFHLLFGAGSRSAIPLIMPSDHKIKNGDIIRFDGGAMYQGYPTDFARCAVVGKPTERLKKLYSTLLKAEQKAIDAMKPGVKMSKIFHLAQETVREAGYPKYSRDAIGIGHGIGLDIMDEPIIVPGNENPLEKGMVICIEVPYYEYGWGGLNIEDIILVTDYGHESLTTFDRKLRVL